MKYLLFALLLVAALITAGCVSGNQNNVITSTQTTITTGQRYVTEVTPSETFSSLDPSAPQSYAEKYCLDVVKMEVSKPIIQGSNNGINYYYPLLTITATVKSNCQFPVEGAVQLFAYDKNKNMIQGGFYNNGVQDTKGINLKPGQTKSVSTTFDIRHIPDNPRDTDPNWYASFNVTAFVTHIVSARDALAWQ